mmetsp:Transcript_3960/g.5538  ORF Transcript_3960/g.5538 Transcript_3960/m.5538 type:complete len:254 (-) Transcript_3960:193-954(-)|eukprot:CAMPEP_0194091252 /NCGR_PEP_ID=MMETSP0149-20130528/42141_1 /TAXON_ID=122233 /ORGANISM="Chaetoceros debilis, Strain MM31A-1" /LENGTH=253 /DNA_ID=CAMNT_0038775759 /DNA_START=230 /DNA_END=991 /DNA_ORIENTATION=-
MHKSSDLSTKKNGSSDSSHSYTSIRTTTQNSLDDEENLTIATTTTAATTTAISAAAKDDEISLEYMNILLLKENANLRISRANLFFVLLVATGLLVVNIQMNHIENSQRDQDLGRPKHHPWPHVGHKLQINASAFTANDYDCLQLDTGNWPSERVHCELSNIEIYGETDLLYDFVVEHFDDEYCQQPNEKLPTVRHTSSGCFYYEKYNHSYHDLCHMNRTFTVSAFEGEGCLVPLNATAVNLLPEDMSMDVDI